MPSNSLNITSSPDELPGKPAERLNDPARTSRPEDERLNIRTQLSQAWDCELMFLTEDEFDEAIIGVVERAGGSPVVAYNTEIILDVLARSMSYEEAQEYFDYNILGAYFGEKTPVYITPKEMLI